MQVPRLPRRAGAIFRFGMQLHPMMNKAPKTPANKTKTANRNGPITLADFTEAVEAAEAGQYTSSMEDRNGGIKYLVDQICSASWTSPEERSRAQGLVIRLVKVKARVTEADQPRSGKPVSTSISSSP